MLSNETIFILRKLYIITANVTPKQKKSKLELTDGKIVLNAKEIVRRI